MTEERELSAIKRPESTLWTYYLISSLMTGPFFPLALIPLRFRYQTMRYRFDEEGVSMRWGVLFRKEINLTYARIQDIHLVSNFVERWLGLARIQIQTASGSAKAEMTIEGIPEFERLRDYLYSRMRGARGLPVPGAPTPVPSSPDGADSSDSGLATILGDAADELRAIRRLLEERTGEGQDD